MKKRIYLIRHGEKAKQIGDPPLSDRGKNQAKRTGEFFKDKIIDVIISSPLLRTIETSKVIAKSLNKSSQIEDLLIERVNWGDSPNQTFEEFIAIWKKASINRSWIPPVGDSSILSGKRLRKVIENIDEDLKNVILVTHGGIITDFLRNEFEDNLLDKYYPHFSKLLDDVILECSITILGYDPNKRKFNLIEIASTNHLKDS